MGRAPKFTLWDKLGMGAILVAVLAGAFWIAVPSSMFLRVHSVLINEDRTVTIVREVPWGPVRARWDTEIITIGREGRECHDGGNSLYQVAEDQRDSTGNEIAGKGRITYELGDWALPCIENGPPFIYHARWSVRLLGIIPLRPTYYSRDYTATQSEDIIPHP